MIHHRYGSLEAIWRKTAGRCHLCHQPVDMCTHGMVRLYGRDAATIDHLFPQSHGGDDDFDNLLPAHHGCNAARGNGSAREARLRLAGTTSRPLSTDARMATGVGITAVAATLAGTAFSHTDDSGQQVFNTEAAFWGGLFGVFVSALTLA